MIVGAFYYAPLAMGFLGESSRILFFHVPMAWASFLGFIAAAVWSIRYLRSRNPAHDRAAQRPLGRIVVERDARVVEEPGEPVHRSSM